jgi:gliding motility-associated-like protein
LFLATRALSQCTTLGQTPATAFPVCGTDAFQQQTVPICTNNNVPAGSCGSYVDNNPFWYKFTCYQSGSLGFLITPANLDDDYDWEIFDITGHDPNEVYTNQSLALTANWSGNTSLESSRGYTGKTGTSTSGTALFTCGTNPPELGQPPPYSDASTFSKMPTLQQGHVYLLLISHFTNTQSGYSLSFGGGTAVITDTTQPRFNGVTTNCDASTMVLHFNKRIRCESLAADGSDIAISNLAAGTKVSSITGNGCATGFDLDSITVTLNNGLPDGTYTVTINKGTDQNTLYDLCTNNIPEGSNASFTLQKGLPVAMDSLTPPTCAAQDLQLVFKKNIKCSSIAADGSDFKITGLYPVTIQSASGNCTNGETSVVNIHLSQPITLAGNFNLSIKTGTDGNTLIDACSLEVVAGQTLPFVMSDTVSAKFTYAFTDGCKNGTVAYTSNDNGNNIYSWMWSFDSGIQSSHADTVLVYKTFGTKTAQLIVTNGFCTDTSYQTLALTHDTLTAKIKGPMFICPNDMATFRDTSIGHITTWQWSFGNGFTSSMQEPSPQTYPNATGITYYTIQLIVGNDKPCFDTTVSTIKAVPNCYIAVPSAFTPNGDGLNDYLYPLNAYKAINLTFKVYNRYGQLVFQTRDWTVKWDGTINGQPQHSGVFVWYLQYTDIDTGEQVLQKGTTTLIR